MYDMHNFKISQEQHDASDPAPTPAAAGDAEPPDGDEGHVLVGASVLPYMVSSSHEIYFVLGMETDWNQRGASLCDFGGKVDSGETAAETALRELDEESLGLMQSPDARDLERGAATLEIGFISRRRAVVSRYVTYVVQVKWQPLLPYQFARLRRRMLRQQAPAHCLEKHKIEIIPAARLRESIRGVRGAPKLRKSFVARMRTALEALGLDAQV